MEVLVECGGLGRVGIDGGLRLVGCGGLGRVWGLVECGGW